jgi:hypothetical protein
MAKLTEQDRKNVLGKAYTPPDPNAVEPMTMWSWLLGKLSFGKKSRKG